MATYDLSKVKTDPKTGFVMTGQYSQINPQYLGEAGYQQALTFAGSSPSSTASPSYQTPASTPYVSDSSSIITGENKTMDALRGLMGGTPQIQSTLTNYGNAADTLANYSNLLEQRRQQQIGDIQSQFNQISEQTKDTQTRETGSTNVALTRLGGYLGGSGSGQGVMQNLALTHRTELARLESQRAAAINAANNAIDDMQFKVATAKVEEAKEAERQMYQRQQDFFNNALKLQSEFRSQQDQVTSNAKDLLDKWQYLSDPSEITPSNKFYVDQVYGPGFTDRYLSTVQASKKAQAEKDQIASVQAYINLLKSVPAGTPIPLGDEIVTAIGDVSDISTFHVEDKNGNVSVVNFNKGTGQYSVTNVGAIGTPSSSGQGPTESDTQQAVSTVMMALYQASDENGKPLVKSDGTFSASAYLQAVDAVQKKFPGTATKIHNQFLNPSLDDNRYFDDTDLNYLRKKTGIGAGYGAVPTE